MKCSCLLSAGLVCYALCFNVQAQNIPPVQKLSPEKTSLFSRLPEKFNISSLWIEKLFSGPDTGLVKIPLTATSYFEGIIMEKVQKNPHVVTMNIKSTNYDGALFSISKIIKNDFTIKYIGRIISIHYGDVIVLTQENNTLSFSRKKQNLVITE